MGAAARFTVPEHDVVTGFLIGAYKPSDQAASDVIDPKFDGLPFTNGVSDGYRLRRVSVSARSP